MEGMEPEHGPRKRVYYFRRLRRGGLTRTEGNHDRAGQSTIDQTGGARHRRAGSLSGKYQAVTSGLAAHPARRVFATLRQIRFGTQEWLATPISPTSKYQAQGSSRNCLD